MHWLARVKTAPVKNFLIRIFIRKYKVDMSLAEEPRPEAYPHFNAFFTRALKEDARPLVPGDDTLACPVDGAVSQLGPIWHRQLLQAKGLDYSLYSLLGGDEGMAALFHNGTFATIYLSPRDYHRIHMPLDGALRRMRYIPGRLYSVNTYSAAHIPGLFTRNERVVTLFDTPAGPMAMILVGAIFVSSMETVWENDLRAAADGAIRDWHYDPDKDPIILRKGEEMGRFNMGSTVILLFEKGRIDLNETLQPGTPVQMGQLLGFLKKTDEKIMGQAISTGKASTSSI